ncbi:MAG: cystathionine gamma-lyase [Marinicellaceae bacterium]
MKNTHKATQIVHSGLSKGKDGDPFMPGPVFASTFHLKGDTDKKTHQYARYSHPTWEVLENAIGELEQAKVLVFPSGMAAIAAILMAVLKTGDTLLLPSDGYHTTRSYAHEILKKFGVKVLALPTLEILNSDLSKVDLVFLETPSNPMLDVIDISKLADKIHANGGLLAIDNTTMTPLGQTPLSLGADITMCSDTKAMNGHSDVLMGHVATNDSKIYEALLTWRKLSGSIPGPMETWLFQRGLASLHMRLERMVKNASQIAQYLDSHEAVHLVRYPGLAQDPSYQVAQSQMNHAGFVISFDLGNKTNADSFLQHTQLIFEATSFGGMHTMAERRARWDASNLSEGLIRLSVGCENVDDILADIDNALSMLG